MRRGVNWMLHFIIMFKPFRLGGQVGKYT